MLRSEIISAASHIESVLRESNIEDAISSNGEDTNRAFESFRHLSQSFVIISAAESYILDLFGLSPLLEPEWWASIVGRQRDKPEHMSMGMWQSVTFATKFLPQIVALLNRSEVPTNLTLIVPEEAAQQSTPERIVTAIQSIDQFYRSICVLHNEPENTLVLTSCDAGSDKSFDFTGIPQIIEQVKDVIFGIADRVIFFRERKYSERVKCVAESLPILEQISQMEEAKKIAPEQAELLRRNLIQGATRFLETGSSIPEIQAAGRYQVSTLLAPKPALLIEGPSGQSPAESSRPKRTSSKSTPKAEEDDIDLKDMSDAEREKLIRLLHRHRRQDDEE
jgi:hypothetical protein